MEGRDPDDWPSAALALARQLPIWSQDKDMEAAGVTVLTTGELLDALREAGGEVG
jgi:predicted nucleic acid-binding protein